MDATLASPMRCISITGSTSGWLYIRLARVAVGSKKPSEITLRNSRLAPYVWAGSALFIAPSLFVWRNTPSLIAIALLFCLGYVWLYFRLTRWRAPAWLDQIFADHAIRSHSLR